MKTLPTSAGDFHAPLSRLSDRERRRFVVLLLTQCGIPRGLIARDYPCMDALAFCLQSCGTEVGLSLAHSVLLRAQAETHPFARRIEWVTEYLGLTRRTYPVNAPGTYTFTLSLGRRLGRDSRNGGTRPYYQ